MPIKPTWSDAWLLAALVMGSDDPSSVVGWADHLNAAIPLPNEWNHAWEVLGGLGLVEPGSPFPRPTRLAHEVFDRCNPPGTYTRHLPDKILAEITLLPEVAKAVAPPTTKASEDAVADYERRSKHWQSGQPTVNLSDAHILTSLVMGKSDPVATLGWTDHLNAAYPNAQEWDHACAVLGRLGLIEPGNPLPRATRLGESLVDRPGRIVASRSTPDLVLADLLKLPIVAEPIPPPDPKILAKASETIERRGKQWSEERKTDTAPTLRDAWLLASLHLGAAIDWRTISIGDEDGPPHPSDADWNHALAVLSKRGLIARRGFTLRLTEEGARLVEDCYPREPSTFRFVLGVLEAIREASADRPAFVPSSWMLRRLERTLTWS